MTAFNRIDSDPRNLSAGSTFQIQDSQGRLVELNTREATQLIGWLAAFLYPGVILRPPVEKPSKEEKNADTFGVETKRAPQQQYQPTSEDEAIYTGLLTALVVRA